MADKRSLRRMFLSAFEAEGLDYVGGGCQIAHPDLTWSISLVVDGTGGAAPYRLILGASVPQLGDLAPRNADDCYLCWPLGYEGSGEPQRDTPLMPDSAFPDWAGTKDERAAAIRRCVESVLGYVRQVDSLGALRARYAAGDYDAALIIAPLRRLLEEAS